MMINKFVFSGIMAAIVIGSGASYADDVTVAHIPSTAAVQSALRTKVDVSGNTPDRVVVTDAAGNITFVESDTIGVIPGAGVLTVRKNGVDVGSFSANADENTAIDIKISGEDIADVDLTAIEERIGVASYDENGVATLKDVNLEIGDKTVTNIVDALVELSNHTSDVNVTGTVGNVVTLSGENGALSASLGVDTAVKAKSENLITSGAVYTELAGVLRNPPEICDRVLCVLGLNTKTTPNSLQWVAVTQTDAEEASMPSTISDTPSGESTP